ncbi:flavin reductase [Sinorhizobium meliloti]|uniref:flavin reductase family protein n=1 Tax=Rhizobium meliloti TaxID=382 RepID=UPI000FD8BBE8|nr:flavin reductase family protein [Sinorhizobium meliloti]RVI98380.1 flavin reductase [Sinorhizobium meliloti]
MKADVFDPRALREAFGAFPTTVTVITASDPAGRPVGFTANSFTSVSLDPPLLLVCVAKTARDYPAMTAAEHFAINILSEAQKDVSIKFARPANDRFAAVDWARGPNGCPIIAQVAAWFECSMHDVIEAGDHVMMVGRVTAFESSGLNGLGYARGDYFTPGANSSAADGEMGAVAVLERHGSLFPLGDDNLSLPSYSAGGGDPAKTLACQLERSGLSVHDWFSLLDL